MPSSPCGESGTSSPAGRCREGGASPDRPCHPEPRRALRRTGLRHDLRYRPMSVLAALALLFAAYAIGWCRLARRSASAVAPWRPLAAAGGLATFGLALTSPLSEAAHQRFAAHMLQHVLMMMLAVPLVLSSDPFAALVWALPRQGRAAVGLLLTRAAPLRRL